MLRCRRFYLFGLGFLSAHGLHDLREAALWHVRRCPGNHLDAVDDGADAEAESAAGAAVLNRGEMSLGVKHNGLPDTETLESLYPHQGRQPATAGRHTIQMQQRPCAVHTQNDSDV